MNSQSQGSVIPGQAQARVSGASPAVQNVVPNNQYANAVANAPSVENPQVPAVSTAAFAPNMFPDRAVDPQQATALLNPDAHLAENDAVIASSKIQLVSKRNAWEFDPRQYANGALRARKSTI